MSRIHSSASRHRPTILDVARHCKLSKATVSKVLTLPDDLCPIADATKQKVRAAVEELGYRPSWQGKALANRRTHMIAIVNADPYGSVPRGQYWDVADEADEVLSKHGLVPTFLHTQANNPRAIEMLSDERFDGCVSLDPQPPEVLEALRRAGMATVLINADVDDSWTHINFDDAAGTEKLMHHLLSLGHKRIAYNAGRRTNTSACAITRAATYTRCMREAGLEADKPFVGSVTDCVERCVTGPYRPTAIIDFEHWTAVRLLQALWRKGVRVPDDMSVATFNDTYPVDLIIPPLTVIGVRMKEVTRKAIGWLTELIDDPKLPPRSETIVGELIVRESTAKPPTGRAQ